MIEFKLKKPKNSVLKLLCLGAHSDDIEIGCGGTILRINREYKEVDINWIVFSSDLQRAREAKTSANAFIKEVKKENIIIKEFRDGFFPYNGSEIKEFFEQIKKKSSPDIIFTHYRNDLHQDHRLICELTWNTFRDHFILEYEIPKYDGDFGSPNFFVNLDHSICNEKVKNIINCFESQTDNHWFTEETFFSLMRLRGIESNSPCKYAEGFYCNKMIMGV